MLTPSIGGRLSTDAELLREFLLRSGATPPDAVVLVGSRTIGLVAGLWRRGFQKVCFAATPWPARTEPADVLWLPRVPAQALDADRLARCARLLRTGGVIVVQGDASTARGSVTALRAMLSASGFGPVEQIVRPQGFCLSAAKAPHGASRLAA